jgi:hypothetical protein
LGSASGSVPIEVGDYLKFVGSAYWGDDVHPDDFTSLYGQSPGGEFKFEVYGHDAQTGARTNELKGAFVTFCAENEAGEYIYRNEYHKVLDILDGSPSDFADWIYWGYLTDAEHGNVVYDRVPGSSSPLHSVTNPDADTEAKSDARAAAVQDALWRALSQGTKGWSDDVYPSWQAAHIADAGWRDDAVYVPKVMVLEREDGGVAQDQWYFMPTPSKDPPASVPEPASLIIWSLLGLGSGGLAVWSGRRRNRLVGGGGSGWSRKNRQAIFSIIERGRLE